MDVADAYARMDPSVRAHVENVAANLQLTADLGYGDVTLLVPHDEGLLVVADARPMTAMSAVPLSRVGQTVDRSDEPEAYDALETGAPACSVRRRIRRGISFTSTGYPIGPADQPYAVAVRHVAQPVAEAPGKMEIAFMRLASLVLERLQAGPLTELESALPYATTRLAGDGVMEVSAQGVITYASPNAVNILRLAGLEGALEGSLATATPGGLTAVAPVPGTDSARGITVAVSGRSLRYRTIGLADGALVLVEDVTDAVRREQELHVKEMAIREVHHRVKNNLQTVASLLRVQARRARSEEAKEVLGQAMRRVAAIAVVHDTLSTGLSQIVDFDVVFDRVLGLAAEVASLHGTTVHPHKTGRFGELPSEYATPLALALTEIVTNAVEHGLAGREGEVNITAERTDDWLAVEVVDTGTGLPGGTVGDGLGTQIVRTLVEGELGGSISWGPDVRGGTMVSIEVPLRWIKA